MYTDKNQGRNFLLFYIKLLFLNFFIKEGNNNA